MPIENWAGYVASVSRWLAWHSIVLRIVRVHFEVRSILRNSSDCSYLPHATESHTVNAMAALHQHIRK